MPLWDHLFNTYREYRKPVEVASLQPKEKQDFVFIGHNGGLGHILTVPEINFYAMYDSYWRSALPIELELLLAEGFVRFTRLIMTSYTLSRYLLDGNYVGRIVCVLHSPMDYLSPAKHELVNASIVRLIREENAKCGTRYFGLGNLNKMKSLNDGGVLLAKTVLLS